MGTLLEDCRELVRRIDAAQAFCLKNGLDPEGPSYVHFVRYGVPPDEEQPPKDGGQQTADS
jgi:hypothetical protein